MEGDERELTHCVQTIGPQPFVFSSDYRHEVNAEICRHEVEEVLENDQLSDSDKQAILYSNALKLYGLKVPSAA